MGEFLECVHARLAFIISNTGKGFDKQLISKQGCLDSYIKLNNFGVDALDNGG